MRSGSEWIVLARLRILRPGIALIRSRMRGSTRCRASDKCSNGLERHRCAAVNSWRPGGRPTSCTRRDRRAAARGLGLIGELRFTRLVKGTGAQCAEPWSTAGARGSAASRRRPSSGDSLTAMLRLRRVRDGERVPVIMEVYRGAQDEGMPFVSMAVCRGSILFGHVAASHFWSPICRSSSGTDRSVKSFARYAVEALDAAIATGRVDSTRAGVMGLSYGGYAVNCIVTHTNRFRAAVSEVGPSHITSARALGGRGVTNVTGAWPWEAPERMVKESPVYHLPKVMTPLLLVAGKHDLGNALQVYEMYFGLLALTNLRRCWPMTVPATVIMIASPSSGRASFRGSRRTSGTMMSAGDLSRLPGIPSFRRVRNRLLRAPDRRCRRCSSVSTRAPHGGVRYATQPAVDFESLARRRRDRERRSGCWAECAGRANREGDH